MNRITQYHSVSQGEKPPSVPAGTKFEGEFREIHESAYAKITQPQRVVVLPRYFITHWLPLLGPSRAWLIVAFRQCAFVTRSDSSEVVRSLSIRQLTRWSGLSHGQVWNLLNDPEYLDWFVRKVASPPEQRESDVWGVQTSVPVAPQHLSNLEEYITHSRPPEDGEKASDYLRKLLKKLPDILYGIQPDPKTERQGRKTVHQIAETVFGPLDKISSQICDEITGRIIQPGNTIAITHYFIDRWLPDLTNGESWMIFVLRTQVYASENTAFAHIEGGKTKLAAMLGVNKRSVRRWFSKLEKSELAHFIKMEGGASSRGFEAEIHLQDPIHPADMSVYQQALDEFRPDPDKTGHLTGQNWTVERTKIDKKADKSDQEARQNWTKKGTKLDSGEDKSDQQSGQKWMKKQTKLDALNRLNRESESSDPNPNWNQLPQQPNPHGDFPTEAVVVGGWKIDTILQTAGVSPHKRQEICEEIRQQPQLGLNLVGWVIYGYENRGESGERNGITSPVLFALSRYQHSEPTPVYIEMAESPPQALAHLMRDHFSPGLRLEWRRVIKGLLNSGFLDILATQPEDRDDPEATPIGSDESELQRFVSNNPARNKSQKKLIRETKTISMSAEELWKEIQGIIGWEEQGEIISMWLNRKELEMSMMQPEILEKLAIQCNKHIEKIRMEFPGYSICLRLIRVTGIAESGLPIVEVVRETQIG